MKVAWFNPFAGIAGDMALGALIDAGAEVDAIEAGCRQLGYDGWRLSVERVERAGIAAVHVRVDIEEQHHHRRAGDILATIAAAGLTERAAQRAEAVFTLLAEAEGRLHGVAPADVHFHEIGAVDSIIDIVGCAIALDLLDIDQVASAPVALGVGTIKAAHGVLPNPAPAVLRVLEGAPVRGVDIDMELTTPTGAALIGALAQQFGALPALDIHTSGYGAGTRNPPGRPNVVQVVIGDGEPTAATDLVCLLETNLDDVTPETVGYIMQRALELGALDAWCTPITMKKSRPGFALTVQCPPSMSTALTHWLARETGTLGIRTRLNARWRADRQFAVCSVDGHPVRVKLGPNGAKAEFEDVAAVARATGRTLRDVGRDALAAVDRISDSPHQTS